MTDGASGPLPVTANFINPETMHQPAGYTQSDRDRLRQEGLTQLGVLSREGLDDQHPAVLEPILAGLLEETVGQLAALHGPVTQHVAVIQAAVGAARPAAMICPSLR
jgi:hypothetical protein